MDFFQRQEIARRNTRWLELYFALAVIGTVLATNAGVTLVWIGYAHLTPESNGAFFWWNPELVLGVTLVTLLLISVSCISKIAQLSSGGSVVAEMFGGMPVNANTDDLNEKRLVNVVEEMAIASGTSVPQIYLLPDESGINAFAAGHSTNDMVICVTAGAVRYLTRDELQGVIGHEFSHILNGDMRLNLRLMGLIFGILSITLLGKILLNVRDRQRGGGAALIGLIFIVVGCMGAFFAKLIKSAVNREREFLAAAAAVQFTRNAEGLACALKKVGNSGSRIEDSNAEEASHFFFANGMAESFFGWMSTHPPLAERILALDPHWDGKFIPVSPISDEPKAEGSERPSMPEKLGALQQLGGVIAAQALPGMTIASAAALAQTGAPDARHLQYAADVMGSIHESLTDAAHSTLSAVGLIYALLLSPDAKVRESQMEKLRSNPVIAEETERLSCIAQNLESRARLPLVTVSMTALGNLSAAQYAQFKANVQALVALDGQVDLFTYVLQKIILRRLDPRFNPPKKISGTRYDSIQPLLPDCSVLLSALACAGQTEPSDIQKAFDQGARKLDDPAHVLRCDPSAYDLGKIDARLDRLNQATPEIKAVILNACAETVATDGVIEENEAELLRAIADTLDCPIPPFLTV